jgi:hypothetical protein
VALINYEVDFTRKLFVVLIIWPIFRMILENKKLRLNELLQLIAHKDSEGFGRCFGRCFCTVFNQKNKQLFHFLILLADILADLTGRQ